jgi:hypothetical protein
MATCSRQGQGNIPPLSRYTDKHNCSLETMQHSFQAIIPGYAKLL